ncbi:hypothetical protein VTO73DRAFT_6879 [Trametes versicolor]
MQRLPLPLPRPPDPHSPHLHVRDAGACAAPHPVRTSDLPPLVQCRPAFRPSSFTASLILAATRADVIVFSAARTEDTYRRDRLRDGHWHCKINLQMPIHAAACTRSRSIAAEAYRTPQRLARAPENEFAYSPVDMFAPDKYSLIPRRLPFTSPLRRTAYAHMGVPGPRLRARIGRRRGRGPTSMLHATASQPHPTEY